MNQELIETIGKLCVDEQYTQKNGDEELLNHFYELFPPDKLDRMTLENYCLGIGTNPDNFCRVCSQSYQALP